MLIYKATINFIQQVILPLLEQYVKSHRRYFLSTSFCSSDNRSHASKKEKEMIARYVLLPTNRTGCWLRWYCFKNFLLLRINLLCENSSDVLCIAIVPFYLRFCHSFVLSIFRFSWPVITFPLLSSLVHLSFLLTSSLFCKLAALVRHRISFFGKNGVKTFSDYNFLDLFSPLVCYLFDHDCVCNVQIFVCAFSKL